MKCLVDFHHLKYQVLYKEDESVVVPYLINDFPLTEVENAKPLGIDLHRRL